MNFGRVHLGFIACVVLCGLFCAAILLRGDTTGVLPLVLMGGVAFAGCVYLYCRRSVDNGQVAESQTGGTQTGGTDVVRKTGAGNLDEL